MQHAPSFFLGAFYIAVFALYFTPIFSCFVNIDGTDSCLIDFEIQLCYDNFANAGHTVWQAKVSDFAAFINIRLRVVPCDSVFLYAGET